jgi:ribosomal protein L23
MREELYNVAVDKVVYLAAYKKGKRVVRQKVAECRDNEVAKSLAKKYNTDLRRKNV